MHDSAKIKGRNTTNIPNLCWGDSERGERTENDEGSDTALKIHHQERGGRENAEEEEVTDGGDEAISNPLPSPLQTDLHPHKSCSSRATPRRRSPSISLTREEGTRTLKSPSSSSLHLRPLHHSPSFRPVTPASLLSPHFFASIYPSVSSSCPSIPLSSSLLVCFLQPSPPKRPSFFLLLLHPLLSPPSSLSATYPPKLSHNFFSNISRNLWEVAERFKHYGYCWFFSWEGFLSKKKIAWCYQRNSTLYFPIYLNLSFFWRWETI